MTEAFGDPRPSIIPRIFVVSHYNLFVAWENICGYFNCFSILSFMSFLLQTLWIKYLFLITHTSRLKVTSAYCTAIFVHKTTINKLNVKSRFLDILSYLKIFKLFLFILQCLNFSSENNCWNSYEKNIEKNIFI